MSSLDFCKKQPCLCISLFLSITCPLSLIIDEVCQTYEISENHQICKSFSTTHPHIRLIHKGGTQQVDTCSKLLIKNCITLREVTVVLSLFKLSNKDTTATRICIILVSLLITFRKLVSCFFTYNFEHAFISFESYLQPDVSLFSLPLHILKVYYQYYRRPKQDNNTIKLYFPGKIIKPLSHFLGNNNRKKI